MTAGKAVAIALLGCMAIAGAALYYLQVFHFYDRLPPRDTVTLALDDGGTAALPVTGYEAIDADSSPIRFRACFDVDPAAVPEGAAHYDGAVPRTAPFWFGCFDAEAIGAAIAEGRATVYVAERNREFGIDRVVAITEAGRGYVWHEINDCGDRAYDGSPLGEDCPARN